MMKLLLIWLFFVLLPITVWVNGIPGLVVNVSFSSFKVVNGKMEFIMRQY
jgi:hypothetical protein